MSGISVADVSNATEDLVGVAKVRSESSERQSAYIRKAQGEALRGRARTLRCGRGALVLTLYWASFERNGGRSRTCVIARAACSSRVAMCAVRARLQNTRNEIGA